MSIIHRYAQHTSGRLRMETGTWDNGRMVGMGNALAPIARDEAAYYDQSLESGWTLLLESEFRALNGDTATVAQTSTVTPKRTRKGK